jgi:HSP20 family protein
MAEKTMATVTNGATAEPIRSGRTVAPRVDIFETDRELVMHADVPGVASGGVDLRYEDGELVLQGKVTANQPGQPVAREFEPADFYRVFRVHDTIDAGKIEAELKNGVLTVHLPKEAKHQPRQVTVKSQA